MLQVIYTMFFKNTQNIMTSSYVFDTYEEVKAFIDQRVVAFENAYYKVTYRYYQENDLYLKAENDTTIHYYTLLES